MEAEKEQTEQEETQEQQVTPTDSCQHPQEEREVSGYVAEPDKEGYVAEGRHLYIGEERKESR